MRLWENAYGRPRFLAPDWELNFGPDGIEGTADDGTASLFGNTTLFTGRELDAETGLFYYRARYFSADLGRFLARDPVYSTPNFFAYCGNSPVGSVDPSGLWKIKRAGDSKAAATTENGDTIYALGLQIGLDPNQFREWLTIPSNLQQI